MHILVHTEGVDPFSRTRKQAIKKAISLSEIALHKWARQGLNLRLPPRQGGTLPLSYAPKQEEFKSNGSSLSIAFSK